MPQHALTYRYVAALQVLCLALACLWLRLIGVSAREFLAQATLTVTGYLRPRPNPLTEQALRAAFAELDKELADILGDRMPYDGRD
ncbi:MAG: hypothetical protein ACRDNW_08170 [Trebonia sp.]